MAATDRRGRWTTHGIVTLVYLVIALWMWSGVWFHHPAATATCGCGDTALFTWFMAWPAHALRHADGLFFTTRLLHPYGINLPANTSVLAIGLPLSPVTWLFGPVASLNVAATLASVGSALAARALVRRWTSWEPASFLAGLFFGFSPFVIESLALEHVDTATLLIPPLLFLCLDELLVRQRGIAWRWGLVLGLLATVQFFVSSEILLICALTAGIGVLVLAIFVAVADRASLGAKWRHAVVGLAIGGATAGALLAYPAWYAVAGPRPLPPQVWPSIQLFGNSVHSLFFSAGPSNRGPNAVLESYGYFGTHPLLMGYLGVGLVAVLVAGLILFRRSPVLWFCAVMLVALEVSSLGAHGGLWRVVGSIPVFRNIVPERLAGIGDLFAAVMLGVIVDRIHAAGRRRTASGDTPERRPSGPARRRSSVLSLVAVVAAGVALVPILWQYDLPFVVRPVDVPTWFTVEGPRLPASAVVLTYPFASSGLQAPMTWQATAGLQFSLVGGGGITPAPPAHPTPSERNAARAAVDLTTLSYGFLPPPTGTPAELTRLRIALTTWGVTTVVVPSEASTPPAIRGRSVPLAIAYFTAALGRAPTKELDAWVWSGTKVRTALVLPPGTVAACAETAKAQVDPGAAADCVLGAGARTNIPAR